jgi:hypothetical protein
MEKIEIQMLLYTLTKKSSIEVHENMSNAFDIYKMVWWFDGKDIGVKPRKPRFNYFYQHILCGIYIYIIIFCICV